MKPSALGVHTVTHPGPDGTLYHFSRPLIVRVAAELRRTRTTVRLGLAVQCAGLAVLSLTWGPSGASRGGRIRLQSCEPTPKGALGTVVDFLPVEGLAVRPMPKLPAAAGRTAFLALPGGVPSRKAAPALRSAILAGGIDADDWTAREAMARALLGADFERVTEVA